MNDAVKHRTPPGPLPNAALASVADRPVYRTNTSQPGGLNKQQMLLLVAVSALIHGGAWWFSSKRGPSRCPRHRKFRK